MDPEIVKSDITDFEYQWDILSEDDKAELILKAADFEAQDAILIVLKGLSSYHLHIRNNARDTLEAVQSRIAFNLSQPSGSRLWNKGQEDSVKVCFRLYSALESNQILSEQHFYFKTLLNTKGTGAYYAFKAFYTQRIAANDAEKIMMTLSEEHRIEFIDQYLNTGPNARLKYCGLFKRMLASIQSRKVVLGYYAQLFDLKSIADPFLRNLDDGLRDPEQVLLREIKSSSIHVRIVGLKALSMMTSQVPTKVLSSLVRNDPDKLVRITVYNIIERSSLGDHAGTFTPLLNRIDGIDADEQYHAAKALIVSGHLPIYSVFEVLKKKVPAVLPRLFEKLSDLGRLSFLVLQDIAMNKGRYENDYSDVNLACIFGLIKKRPERVVRILKQFDNHPDDALRIAVTGFIEKTRTLLDMEKESISSYFKDIISRVEKKNKKTDSIFNAIFTTAGQKKINQLLTNKQTTAIHFNGHTISNTNFSSTIFRPSALYFNQSMIVNCDFSKAGFTNAYFRNCIFYNVNMRKTRFNQAIFDNAIFINVNAQSARFQNCSFQQAGLYNCNFNRAELKHACFVHANLAKSSLKHADMSGCTFAHADIAAVSFLHTNIEQVDFFNTQARFCRFPNSFRTSFASANVEYNARRHQLSAGDIPKLSKGCLRRLNLLLFSEFIHYGEKKFSRQNQISLLTAFDIFKPKVAHLFQIIPYLLHENIVLPGMDDTILPKTPFGIFDYMPDKESRQILCEYKKSKNLPFRRHDHAWIEGLFTIGSVGSMAQTIDSDIDYWVCINENRFSKHQINLLQKKLTIIEAYARQHFQTQLTFFIVDIDKAKSNDFGGSTIESSGSAQSRLLKEEFYRTMIHVAGKLPLWSVLPTPVSLNYYNAIQDWVARGNQTSRYLDLGDIHAIPTSEYFGASIWQMFKWLKSPFKSVIKMALLEKYIYEYGKKPLLCNTYKDHWMNSGVNLNLAQNDSYYILLDQLIDYYKAIGNPDSVSILLTCFFLKLAAASDAQIDNTSFGLRKVLLDHSLKKWGWKKEAVYDIGSFKSWQYKEIAQLSTTIENYMVKKYKTVNKAFEKMSQARSQISPEDRTMLGRKVFIEFSRQTDKVNKVLLISRSDRHFSGLHLKYVKKIGSVGTWELVNRNARAFHGREEALIRARTIEEIGAWLIHNGLYNESSIINLVPNPTYVTHDDIRKLFKEMYTFLKPLLRQRVGFERLLEKNQVEDLFVSINFYAPRQQHSVTEYTAVYLTTWGEMFSKSVYSVNGFVNMESARKDILNRLEIERLPENTVFYFSKGAAR